jgi:hypothetical protein
VCNNPIIYIEITHYARYLPDIRIHRRGGINHFYDLDRLDDNFNKHRFGRIVQMATELYRRQSDASDDTN